MSVILWRQGEAGEINSILSGYHYLGPLKSGAKKLIVVGESDGQVVAGQVWKLPTTRWLPNDGSWLELARWCLTPMAGPNAGSRNHKWAVRLIKELLPDVTTLVSYSDPAHGHTGALYRACNWQWRPAWQRLRPPPSGGGAWVTGQRQEPKDRWIFEVRPDDRRSTILSVKDPGAVRYWIKNAPADQRRWARSHPELGDVA